MADSVGKAVNLVRSTRLFPGAPYAYAARASQGDLVFTAGACPLDEQGRVVYPGDVRAPAAATVFSGPQSGYVTS
jgi:enamine deaminase RidA (YjgF/YER057c/UK114 family)